MRSQQARQHAPGGLLALAPRAAAPPGGGAAARGEAASAARPHPSPEGAGKQGNRRLLCSALALGRRGGRRTGGAGRRLVALKNAVRVRGRGERSPPCKRRARRCGNRAGRAPLQQGASNEWPAWAAGEGPEVSRRQIGRCGRPSCAHRETKRWFEYIILYKYTRPDRSKYIVYTRTNMYIMQQ